MWLDQHPHFVFFKKFTYRNKGPMVICVFVALQTISRGTCSFKASFNTFLHEVTFWVKFPFVVAVQSRKRQNMESYLHWECGVIMYRPDIKPHCSAWMNSHDSELRMKTVFLWVDIFMLRSVFSPWCPVFHCSTLFHRNCQSTQASCLT